MARNYHEGSLIDLNIRARSYEDILVIRAQKKDNNTIALIVCRPDYDEEQIKKFAYENIPLGIDYEIIVEEKV